MMMEADVPPANQHRPHLRVLIVDDTPQVRRDLRQFLELTGDLEVVAEAADGQQAVHLAAELSPDVILMDLEMPGMDGFEATRQLKSQGLASRVVVLSMHASPENIRRALSIGADEFVAKGEDFNVLIDAILGHNPLPNSTHS